MSKTNIGEMGKSSKIITFKKENFKRELAPSNAKIDEFNKDGQSYIKMQY